MVKAKQMIITQGNDVRETHPGGGRAIAFGISQPVESSVLRHRHGTAMDQRRDKDIWHDRDYSIGSSRRRFGRIGNQNQLHLGRRAVLPVNSVFKCDCPDSVAVSSLRGSACIYQLAQPFRAGLNSLPALRADSMHWFTVSVLSERYWASTVPG